MMKHDDKQQMNKKKLPQPHKNGGTGVSEIRHIYEREWKTNTGER